MVSFFKNILYIFILIAVSVTCFSCKSNQSSKSAKAKINAKDSIELIDNFSAALTQPDLRDSILMVNQNLFESKNELYEIYHYGLARFYIQSMQFNKAERIISEALITLKDDSLSVMTGKFYNLLGAKAAYQNDHEMAIQHFQKALKIFETRKNLQEIAIIKFNLSNMFLGRLEYEKAHNYSMEAHKVFEELKDSTYLYLCKAMVAITAIQENKDIDATQWANEALQMSQEKNNLQGIILSYYALGEIDAYHLNYQSAIGHFDKAADLSEKYQLTQTLLASKAALLKSHLELGNFLLAIEEGKVALELAEQTNNEEIYYSLYKNLAESYKGIGETEQAYQFMKNAGESYLIKSNKNNQEIIQDLLIGYETEKMNNLILEQENKIKVNQMWITLLIFFVIISILLAYFIKRFYTQKRRILIQQNEKDLLIALTEREEEENKRISEELHDGIASMLIGIKLNLESQQHKDPEQAKILNMVLSAHKEVRQIAQNLRPINFESTSLTKAIHNFCQLNSTDNCPVLFYNKAEQLKISKTKAHVLYRITQELIQNALKYSEACKIEVTYILEADHLKIIVEDDGIGFDWQKNKQKGGLQSIQPRLQKLNGTLEIDTRPGNGTVIFIDIKL